MARTDTGLLVALAALAATASCNAAEEVAAPVEARRPAIRITDDLGREVAIERPATRIAALAPCFVESLFAIGCGGCVILRDTWSDHPSPGVDAIPKVDGVQVSVRNVAGFSPDIVLLFADDGRNADTFERVGLKVAVLHPDNYEEVAADLVKLGALCGREAEARREAEEMLAVREEVARGIGAAPRPSVYVEIDAADPTRPWTAGPGSFVAELVELAGGRNAASGVTKPYVQISAEAIIRAAPEVVLVAHNGLAGKDAAAEIMGRPGWSSLAAASAGRVIAEIDGDLLSRPGPRLADGLRALAAALRERAPVDGGAP
ncbi:MAG: ABC transporter substrate-binding protein [Proteobacteria bacterium]|jgi:iron complex transport system substrate-binding protein|nr:ABC transporter substrate-binding protein [Pseudomonadota bacterium]